MTAGPLCVRTATIYTSCYRSAALNFRFALNEHFVYVRACDHPRFHAPWEYTYNWKIKAVATKRRWAGPYVFVMVSLANYCAIRHCFTPGPVLTWWCGLQAAVTTCELESLWYPAAAQCPRSQHAMAYKSGVHFMWKMGRGERGAYRYFFPTSSPEN